MNIVMLTHEPNTSWKDHPDLFLLNLKAQGLSMMCTSHYYEYHVSHFFRLFPDALESYEKSKYAALRFLADEKIGPVAFNHRLRHVKTFFQWLVSEGYVARNPFDGFKKRRESGRIVTVDIDTIKTLLTHPDRTWF